MFKPVSSNVPIKVWMKILSGLMRKAASELSQVLMVNIIECEVKWNDWLVPNDQSVVSGVPLNNINLVEPSLAKRVFTIWNIHVR